MPIAGYHIYYLKQGRPIMGYDGSITEIPLTLESAVVPVELEESAKVMIEQNGNTVLREEVIAEWFELNGLQL